MSRWSKKTREEKDAIYARAKQLAQQKRIRIGAKVKCPQCDFVGFSLSGHRKVHQ